MIQNNIHLSHRIFAQILAAGLKSGNSIAVPLQSVGDDFGSEFEPHASEAGIDFMLVSQEDGITLLLVWSPRQVEISVNRCPPGGKLIATDLGGNKYYQGQPVVDVYRWHN